MISKGKRKHLVWLYSILSVYRKMGLPCSGIDVMKLSQRSQRLTKLLKESAKPIDHEYFNVWTSTPPKIGSFESFKQAGKIMTEVIAGAQRRQSQEIVRKPRVVLREVDHSDPTLPRNNRLILPFPDKGPL